MVVASVVGCVAAPALSIGQPIPLWMSSKRSVNAGSTCDRNRAIEFAGGSGGFVGVRWKGDGLSRNRFVRS